MQKIVANEDSGLYGIDTTSQKILANDGSELRGGWRGIELKIL